MELVFRFFDNKSWSYYATINVVIPTILILLSQGYMTTQDLIFVSLLGMMEEGNLYSKILMTGFLNFLVFIPNIEWLKRSIIYVVSIILMNTVSRNNKVYKTVMGSNILQLFMNILIALWMGYILYVILYKLYKYGRTFGKNRK